MNKPSLLFLILPLKLFLTILTFLSDKNKKINTIRINSIYALISVIAAAKKTTAKITKLYLILILYKTLKEENMTSMSPI